MVVKNRRLVERYWRLCVVVKLVPGSQTLVHVSVLCVKTLTGKVVCGWWTTMVFINSKILISIWLIWLM